MARQKKTTVCPLGGAGIGGKWKFWIMYHLLSGTRRFGELQRLLPQASRQMLTIQLRELEQMGVLHRQASVQGVPKGRIRTFGTGTTVRADGSSNVCVGEMVLRSDRPGV